MEFPKELTLGFYLPLGVNVLAVNWYFGFILSCDDNILIDGQMDQ